jgi:hypothetical protein
MKLRIIDSSQIESKAREFGYILVTAAAHNLFRPAMH